MPNGIGGTSTTEPCGGGAGRQPDLFGQRVQPRGRLAGDAGTAGGLVDRLDEDAQVGGQGGVVGGLAGRGQRVAEACREREDHRAGGRGGAGAAAPIRADWTACGDDTPERT